MSATNIVINNTAAKTGQAKKSVQSSAVIFYCKLLMLYLLNVSDWLCTEALLASGRFYEANPVMSFVIGDFWLTLLVKGILPLLLVLLCAFLFRLVEYKESKLAITIINIGIIIYLLLNLWHIANFVLLFFVF